VGEEGAARGRGGKKQAGRSREEGSSRPPKEVDTDTHTQRGGRVQETDVWGRSQFQVRPVGSWSWWGRGFNRPCSR
jgi:hypothetical protein